MRRTNIDELPTFNVYEIFLSVIGPRPHMLIRYQQYSEVINNYPGTFMPSPEFQAQVAQFRGETKN
jgi:lipopolysaccharide/colanic/teichoic acid biosynthesis glycosyltransferase